jgi:hypothetical protein
MIRFHTILLAVVAAGCMDRSPTVPADLHDLAAGRLAAHDRPDHRAITVMAQNLYVGADVDAVIGALASLDPTDDFPALLFAIETLGKTDFPARAAAIADEIARRRPHAVGLQEASVIDIDLTRYGIPIVKLDFLAILRAELAERGLNYSVAATVQNIAAVPVSGISLVDFDVLLVDAERVTVTAAGGQNFSANVGPVAPGVALIRGWTWARTTVAGRPITFVSTHAEADLGGAQLSDLRALQIAELIGTLASDAQVVLMGDLNDTPGSPMYQVLKRAGFTDVWAALQSGERGNTCCHVADLSNPAAALSKRIDYVFTRDGDGRREGLSGEIARFGAVSGDRVAGPAYRIWPSDHAGLVATLQR